MRYIGVEVRYQVGVHTGLYIRNLYSYIFEKVRDIDTKNETYR